VSKVVARSVVAFALFLGVDRFAQSADAPERTQLANGLSTSGCEAHARANPPCSFELVGPVTRAQAEAFEKFLHRRGNLYGFELEITSGGGSVDAAMTFGTRLRERGATVIAHGECGTACVLVLAGGTYRSTKDARVTINHPYPDNASELGEHRSERYIERINNPIATYLERMGLPGSLLSAMLAVPAGETRSLNARELRDYGLTSSAY